MSTSHGTTDAGGIGKANQDTFFAAGNFFGVFDGHGEHGAEIATAVRDSLLAAGPDADPEAAFAAADVAARAAIIDKLRKAGQTVMPGCEKSGTIYRMSWSGTPILARGGTTATVVRHLGDELRVAHVGDSEVMVIDAISGDFRIITADHSSTSVTEYVRALREATVPLRVEFNTLNGMPPQGGWRSAFTAGSDGNVQPNPAGGHYHSNVRKEWAAYVRGTQEGLNMLRAIGDFSLKSSGVTSRPEIVTHRLHRRSYVVVASDGLYDGMSYEAIRDCVMGAVAAAATAEAIQAELMREGLAINRKHFGPGQDNITVVVGICEPPAAAQLRFPLGYGYLARSYAADEMLRAMVATRHAGCGFSYRVGQTEPVVAGRQIAFAEARAAIRSA
jgi:serine/threonine protein phosphatase PrpC